MPSGIRCMLMRGGTSKGAYFLAPVEQLELVWRALEVQRAVLTQGSAHGADHSALLAAIARAPESRRGIAFGLPGMKDETLALLQEGGIRAVRFHWLNEAKHISAYFPWSPESCYENGYSCSQRATYLC